MKVEVKHATEPYLGFDSLISIVALRHARTSLQYYDYSYDESLHRARQHMDRSHEQAAGKRYIPVSLKNDVAKWCNLKETDEHALFEAFDENYDWTGFVTDPMSRRLSRQ